MFIYIFEWTVQQWPATLSEVTHSTCGDGISINLIVFLGKVIR